MDEKLKLAYKKLILINSLLTNNLHYRIFITEGPGPQCATALSIEREVDELLMNLVQPLGRFLKIKIIQYF